MGLAHEGPGRPIRARSKKAKGRPLGTGPQGPRGPTRARPARAQGGATRAGPARVRVVHKGPAYKGPGEPTSEDQGGPTRARPIRAQGAPLGPGL